MRECFQRRRRWLRTLFLIPLKYFKFQFIHHLLAVYWLFFLVVSALSAPTSIPKRTPCPQKRRRSPHWGPRPGTRTKRSRLRLRLRVPSRANAQEKDRGNDGDLYGRADNEVRRNIKFKFYPIGPNTFGRRDGNAIVTFEKDRYIIDDIVCKKI